MAYRLASSREPFIHHHLFFVFSTRASIFCSVLSSFMSFFAENNWTFMNMMWLVRNSFSYLFGLDLFLMDQKQIFCLFSFDSNNIPQLISVGFSGIRNRIVIMEGKHADCKATMIALEDLLENTHLLCKGKYNCTADLLFDSFGFKQSSEFVFNST